MCRIFGPPKRGIALLVLLLVAVLLVILSQRFKPVGGEIFAPDLRNGVKVYVEEGYTVTSTSKYTPSVIEPHSIWLVTDETLGDEILRLCDKIEHYRQFEPYYDVMMGGGEDTQKECCPSIYLLTDAIAYKIEMLNWDNYPAPPWTDLPIRRELLGEPVFHFYRIDLSIKPEDKPLYAFVRGYFEADTLNNEYGMGWYSTMSRQDMDALLRLLDSVGAANAEEVAEIPAGQ